MKKKPMPGYYGKNIAQHAQKRFFQRKALEANQALGGGAATALSCAERGPREKRRDCPAEAVGSGKKE